MAEKWGMPPWELEGEEKSAWNVYIWQQRFALYENEVIEKQQRDIEKINTSRR